MDELEKIMEEVEINVDGLTDKIKSYELSPEQYEWFLLQVSKTQELIESNVQMCKNQQKIRRASKEWFEKVSELHKENQCHKKALNF